MKKLQFLEPLLGKNVVYEDIILGLMEEKMTLEQIHDYTEKEGHSYKLRTIRQKLGDLQSHNLVAKERGPERKCFYFIPDWHFFKSNTIDPIRRDAKRQIFDKKGY